MGTFKGKRIIPKHDGVWDQKKEYEELTIVLDAESGDGYISRKPVPAGTVLSDTDYWSLCSHFNAQMHRLETDVAEDVEGMHKDLSETKASMSKEVSEAESRVNTKVSDAQSAMQKTEDAMNTAVEQMNKRLDANVTASTDAKADYAAELVDVRVGQDGTVYPSAGEAIRGQYSQAVENGITGAKLALAGSNGNLGEVFPKAAMPALLGAKCEAGEFLDYRITGTTDYGQFYHRFTNMLMGKFRKYLFISKIREISGSCAGVSCYQYDSKGANLNTHVTKAVRVSHGSEIYVVFFGEILENAYRLDISPCVARKEAVVECDSRCVLLDVTGQSDDELQKVLSLISSSPVEDSILQYYDTWGIAGKVMSVPYADRTGISDQAREMLGNVAYGCPVFSEMIPFSSKFQEKDTTYAWVKATVTRDKDWGVFGGFCLNGLAAGKYLVFGRVESVETDDSQLGEVSIGIIEPGIPNWAKRVPCGTLNKATLPFQMNLVYEYVGGKDNLNFAVQLTGSNYTSFVVTMWVLNVTGLSNEEIEALSHSSITERASAVKNGKLRFNTSCLKKFEDVEYVELLLNSVDRCVAIRPCEKGNPNAIHWGRLKEGRWCASTLGCRGLAKTLFDIMEWEEGLKYRFRGQFVEQGDNKLMLFELDEPEMIKIEEIVLPSKEEEAEGKTVKQMIYIFPPEWAGTFGQPITSIAQVGILQQEHYAGNWDVLRPAAEIKEMNTFTADGLNTLLHEAEEIMEGWTDTNE